MPNYCITCNCEIPDDPTNRQPIGMEPEYCNQCDPESPDTREEE